MTGGLPPWWTSNMLELIQRREAMPQVERLQTCYIKYRRANEAQVAGAAGWDASTSRRNYEQMARLDPHHYMAPDDQSPLYSALCPDNITMRIIEAPAEFGVPVKQDRRLSPSFKVRVEVRYRQRVAVPVTVKAHLVTQQDKDNILAWLPEEFMPYAGMEDKNQRSMTELKGNTCITHHFEANNGGMSAPTLLGGDRSGQGLLGGAGGMRGLGLNGNGLANGLGNGMGNGINGIGNGMGGMGDLGGPRPGTRLLDTSPSALATLKTLGIKNGSIMGWGGQSVQDDKTMMEHLLLQQGMTHNGMLGGHSNGLEPGLLGGGAGGGFGGNNVHQLMQQLGGNLLMLNNGPAGAQVQAVQQLQQLQQQQQVVQQQQAVAAAQAAQAAQEEAAAAVAHAQQTLLAGMGANGGGVETSVLTHDYEFTNLELLKPTRMNKVYLVFSATILDSDALYVVFNVPTIGICRAEQREKACQKLNVPMPHALDASAAVTAATPLSMAVPPGLLKSEVMGDAGGGTGIGQAGGRKRVDRIGLGESDESDGFQPINSPPMVRMAGGSGSGAMGAREAEMMGPGMPRTRMALQEWIMEEYESTGLTRKLSRLDLQALLSQAGFPTDAAHEHATVSQVQWDEFCAQFRTVLRLLRQIAGVWNLEDPCVVCGFDMDRQGTIQALNSEPAGTFLCRFSMSQPGCLVLSCKTAPGHPNADADGLIHAIINIDDLHERRVDTWIRDYVGASHVLDVYRQKRVDKRKVFTSNYTRLKGMDSTQLGAGSEFVNGFGTTEVA